MKTTGIYRIDLGNNNFYIGSAVNIAKREQQHRGHLKREVHCNKFVQNCWNKYGVFEFTVLEECAKDDLLLREQFHIDQHRDNPKMANIALTAGSCLAIKHSDEARARMSAAQKLRIPPSDETRTKLSVAAMGRVHLDESRAKISAAQMGRIVSDETRANMSAAAMAYWARIKLEKQLLKEVA